MNERKKQLMEAGLALISVKGYHDTTIQEITDEAKMSKGSFYVYFSSKEAFIVTAFQYFHTKLTKRLQEVDQKNGSNREKLAKQTTVIMEYMSTYRNVILTYFQEDIPVGEQMETMIQHINQEKFYWISNHLKRIYEEEVEQFLIDMAIQFEGILSGYLHWLLTENVAFDFQEAGHFIVRRMDDLFAGMLKKERQPLVKSIPAIHDLHTSVQEIMLELSVTIRQLDLPAKHGSHLEEVWKTIQEELKKEKPSQVVMQGLLVHFQQFAELGPACEKIASIFGFDLIGLNE